MTGFDTEWHDNGGEGQTKVMVVHFRPDKLPEDKAAWYTMLGNYALTTAKLIRAGVIHE